MNVNGGGSMEWQLRKGYVQQNHIDVYLFSYRHLISNLHLFFLNFTHSCFAPKSHPLFYKHHIPIIIITPPL